MRKEPRARLCGIVRASHPLLPWSGAMQIPPDGNYVTTGLVLFPRHEQAIDHILEEIRRKIPARLVIVTARDGQFIAASGDQTHNVDLVALGSPPAGGPARRPH